MRTANDMMYVRISCIPNCKKFDDALHLYPTTEVLTAFNMLGLQANGQSVATIKALHCGPNAAKASADGTLEPEPVIALAHGARVMLTFNLWIVDTGLVNSTMGTVVATCYPSGGPLSFLLQLWWFDSYSGLTMHDGSVPFTPLWRISNCH